ncbi:MAG: hypothetical protein WCE81_06920 [Halobacteriota archaeon]
MKSSMPTILYMSVSPPYAIFIMPRHKHKRRLPLAMFEHRIESLLLYSYLENNITPIEEKLPYEEYRSMEEKLPYEEYRSY